MIECPRCGASLRAKAGEKVCDYCGYRCTEDLITLQVIRAMKLIELTEVLKRILVKRRVASSKTVVAIPKQAFPKASKKKTPQISKRDEAARYRTIAQNARCEVSAIVPVFGILAYVVVGYFWMQKQFLCAIPVFGGVGLPIFLLIVNSYYTRAFDKGEFRRALNLKQVIIALKALIVVSLGFSILILAIAKSW